MITGVIGLEFKDGTDEETIRKIISQIYAQNKDCIQNMQYFEFEDPKTLKQLYEICRNDEMPIHEPIPFLNVPNQDMAISGVRKKPMKFEIMQPSDKCFIEGDDFKTICITTIILGEGKYGLQEVDGELHMPPVIFAPDWFKTTFGVTEKDAILNVDPKELIPILKSVKLKGERSSLNDIEGHAKKLVTFLEKKTETEMKKT